MTIELSKRSKILHATSVDILGQGVSIIGESGFGKSSLAIKLIARGADLVSDDQTLFEYKNGKIILSKPVPCPPAIEARGLGLIALPTVKKTELFYFIKLTNKIIERLPQIDTKICFGKAIQVIPFNPKSGNEAALFLRLKYGLIDDLSGK